MPPPAFVKWCSDKLHDIACDIVDKYATTKRDLEIPSQVLESEGIHGQKPGEKWKNFNEIVNKIVENVKNGDELDIQLSSITPVLLNHVKVNIAIKLQLSNFIAESLKSEDIRINKKALSARWFFDGGNPRVTAEYFVKDILPYVSVRTRLDVIKRLARGLRGHEAKAEMFFFEFVDLFGIRENLPILAACSENFIFDSILRYKIVVPPKILQVLYTRCQRRNIVVRYLQLCNKNNAENVNINDYDLILPILIRHYPEVFITLYTLTPEKILSTLSSRRTAQLLAKVKHDIIGRSDIFFKLLQPKVVKRKLSREDIETSLENWLPKDVTEFSLGSALEFVDSYVGSDTADIEVLMCKFEKLYNKSLLEYTRKLIESDTKSALKLLRRLSVTDRQHQVKLLLDNIVDLELKNVLISYSNSSESLPYFKNKISKSSSADERMRLINLMIVSCSVQGNKNDLLEVLKYYRDRHKNEQNTVLRQFLECLQSEFSFDALDDAHWAILREIINDSHIRKELFKSHVTLIETVLEAMLRHAMTRKIKNDRHVDEAVEMIVECKLEKFSPSWNIFKDNLQLEKECLERFFMLIPVKYRLEHHPIWKEKNNRLVLTLSLVKSFDKYNKNSQAALRKAGTAKMNLKDYPWILNLASEFISREETGFRKELLRKLVKLHAPDFYEKKMSESSSVRDISNEDALQLLKRHPEKIVENYMEYLKEARDKLQKGERASFDNAREKLRARRFIAATKWHDELPVKFIEACWSEIKVEGSLAVLGLLLPGESFEKIVAAYAPKEQQQQTDARESFEMACAILEGMKLTNPPVSLASLQIFCRRPYLSIADGTLTSLARRVSVGSAVEFAKKLASQPQASLIKRGVRLAKSVTTIQQFRDVLDETWRKHAAADVSIKRLLARMIFDSFVALPHTSNWQLMLHCLRGLTVGDEEALQDLNDIEKIGSSEFLSDYVEEYLSKVEEIFAVSLDFQWRTKCVCLLIESFDDKLTNDLSQEVSLKILKKYFFDVDCAEISRSVRTFAVRYYLLAAPDGTGEDKFGSRLNVLVSILKKTTESFDMPHTKKRRFYPANYSVQEFFSGLLNELCASTSDTGKKLRIVDSVLEIFKMSLSPWQEPTSYVALNLYKDYLLSTTPVDFGTRAAKRIVMLVEDLASNEPIADIADCLNDFIFGKIFRDQKNPYNLKLSLIEGMLQGDEYYGALASTKLLDPREVVEYDERYDRLVHTLRQMKNSSIQYNLYRHLNHLSDQ